MKNKLIEILESAESAFYWNSSDKAFIEKIADHLISNGVTIQRWIPVEERLPESNGKYMVCSSVRGRKYIDCVSFARDLYMIDTYDFHRSKGKSGFYEYDNEYGFYEYEGVTHWTHLPEPPQED